MSTISAGSIAEEGTSWVFAEEEGPGSLHIHSSSGLRQGASSSLRVPSGLAHRRAPHPLLFPPPTSLSPSLFTCLFRIPNHYEFFTKELDSSQLDDIRARASAPLLESPSLCALFSFRRMCHLLGRRRDEGRRGVP